MVGGNISSIATFCVVSATLSAAICCYAKTVGNAIQLLDKPDGVRKLHKEETPLIGGLALLVPSFAVSIIYLTNIVHAPFMAVAVAAAAFTLVVGLIDDRSGLSPVWRLVALTFIVFAAFSAEPLFVLHTLRLGGFTHNIAVSLDPLAAPITAIIILGFVNATNMADGMNGQLLGSVVIWCVFISLHLGIDVGLPFIAVICSALVTITFNLRGRLFSGSSGAYAASVFVALGAIAAYRRAGGALPAEMPAFWFWLPVLDCMRLMVTRMFAGKSPLAGDRNHFHHMLHDYMRMRYALPVYLGLLAAPGAVAEINSARGSVALLICVGIYAAFIILRYVHVSRLRALVTTSPSLAMQAFDHFPVLRHRLGVTAPQQKTAHALQDTDRPAGSKVRA